jgi:hypothetical protein
MASNIIPHVDVLTPHGLNVYRPYFRHPPTRAIQVGYRGHKDDLAAAGCLKFASRGFDRFLDDDHGGIWYITSKAGPGKRGYVAVDYFVCDFSFAASLPGVRDCFPQALARLAAGQLRLVVDNTRGVCHVQ